MKCTNVVWSDLESPESRPEGEQRKQHPDVDPSKLSQLTIDQICETPNSRQRDICSTNQNLNLMSAAALWAGGIGLVLLLVIRLVGSAAQTMTRDSHCSSTGSSVSCRLSARDRNFRYHPTSTFSQHLPSILRVASSTCARVAAGRSCGFACLSLVHRYLL